MDRRRFLLASGSAASLAACSSSAGFVPGFGPIPTSPPAPPARYTRLEIEEFSADARLLQSYRDGVAAMMAISDPRDVRSWGFWHNSHWMAFDRPPHEYAKIWNACRHRKPYFYAWHRGFVYYYERVLRHMSGNPKFALPYWDYYKNPAIPAAFAQPRLRGGKPNPLYWKNRTGHVIRGLDFYPFHDSIKAFPIGTRDAYEALVEADPHGTVHDQVGGDMGSVPTAALDPIFYVHHCNIDRLWTAWLDAGDGRAMPPASDPYWDQRFTYDLSGSWQLGVREMVDAARLGYGYGDTSLPAKPAGAMTPARPPMRSAEGPFELGGEAFSVAVPGKGNRVLLEGLSLTELGRRGGYAIRIYANLPQRPVSVDRAGHFAIGELGSFTFSAAQMGAMSGAAMPATVDLSLVLPRGSGAGETIVSFVPFMGAEIPRNAMLARFSRLIA